VNLPVCTIEIAISEGFSGNFCQIHRFTVSHSDLVGDCQVGGSTRVIDTVDGIVHSRGNGEKSTPPRLAVVPLMNTEAALVTEAKRFIQCHGV
jgi:hypothetical protein